MNKKRLISGCVGAIAAVVVILIVANVVVPGNKYKKAAEMYENGDYSGAVKGFTELGDYKDSKDKASEAQTAADYVEAQALYDDGKYSEAVEAFTALGEYEDSKDKAEAAQLIVDYDSAQALYDEEKYAEAVEAFTALGEYEDSKDKAEAAQLIVDYDAAQALYDDEKYAEAVAAFTALGEYEDSKDKAEAAQLIVDYDAAQALYDDEKYAEAVAAFTALGEYEDSKDKAEAAQLIVDYDAAQALYDDGKYAEAVAAFTALGEYEDSKDKAAAAQLIVDYDAAQALYDDGKYAEAVAAFTALGEYEDSKDKAAAAQLIVDYDAAQALYDDEKYAEAVAAFTALGEYEDSKDKAAAAQLIVDYDAAQALYDDGKYAEAVAAFTALGEYEDSKDKAAAAQLIVDYDAAQALYDDGKYAEAVEAFTALGEYEDSKDKAEAAQLAVEYEAAGALVENGEYEQAIKAFTDLGDYKDSPAQAQSAQEKLDRRIAQENLENYNSAKSMEEAGAYSDAYKIFSELGDYSDSAEKCEEVRTKRFDEGKELFNDGKYEKAKDIFTEVAGWTYHEEYAEVDELAPEYYVAWSLFRMDRFDEAHTAFTELGDYSDSAQAAQNCLDEPEYRSAVALFEEEKYEEAKTVFDRLEGYRDSAGYSADCASHISYNLLMDQVTAADDYEEGSDDQKKILKEAFDGFIALGDFSDSRDQAYRIAERFFAAGAYENCEDMYAALGDYEDSHDRLNEVKNIIAYQNASEILSSAEEEEDPDTKEKLYEEALNAFFELGDYSDSRDKVYALAERYLETDDLESAVAVFQSLGDYRDSRKRIGVICDEFAYREALSIKEQGFYKDALRRFIELCSTEENYESAEYDPDDEFFGEEVELAAEDDTIEWKSADAEMLVPDGLRSGYKDSLDQIESILNLYREEDYQKAAALKDAGDFEAAAEGFELLGDYGDSSTQVEECREAIMQKEAEAEEAVESVAEDLLIDLSAADVLAAGEFMTHDEYSAAADGDLVVIDTFVQAKSSYWEGKTTLYCESEDGAYFIYDLPVSEEEYEALAEGAEIKIAGYKTEWSGQVEIDGSDELAFEIGDGRFIADAVDVTDLLGTAELEEHMTEKVIFQDAEVVASEDPDGNEVPFLYNYDGSGEEGNDVYFNVSIGGEVYTFLVRSYVTDKDTDVYKAAQALEIGDVIDMEGFLYWYNGPNPHITSITAEE